MFSFQQYIKQYVRSLNPWVFGITTVFVALLVALNYTLGIETRIAHLQGNGARILAFFLLFFFVYGMAWWVHFAASGYFWPKNRSYYFLLVLAPLLFAIKAGLTDLSWIVPGPGTDPKSWLFYKMVLNWPLKAILMLGALWICWRGMGWEKPVSGLTRNNFSAGPYLLLFLLMIPLVALAATQPDFLKVYPKAALIGRLFPDSAAASWKYLLFELSYGSDFFTIELFFRGFLVLAFIRFAGKDAILPMAAFYCSIHFGKPLFECVTSYFGGLILGVIVYRTGSIWGGLIVHLGIAWLMELAGAVAKGWH